MRHMTPSTGPVKSARILPHCLVAVSQKWNAALMHSEHAEQLIFKLAMPLLIIGQLTKLGARRFILDGLLSSLFCKLFGILIRYCDVMQL